MGTAATKAKRKWNNEHYTNITAAMNPVLADRLKKDCKEKGISVTSVITRLIVEHLDADISDSKETLQQNDPGTVARQSRELWEHIVAIEDICNSEEQHLSSTLNRQSAGSNNENRLGHMSSAIAQLKEAYTAGGYRL